MKKLNLELNLFDGESAAGGAPISADSPQATLAQSQNTDAPMSTDSDKNAEFEKLIKGEYKEQFEQRIKDNLKRRFKESSTLKARVSQNDEIINMLKVKYGIADGNEEKIAEAIRNDNSFLKEEAMKQGIEPDILQRIKELEFENRNMKMQIEQSIEEQKMQTAVNSWVRDAHEIEKSYPDFDLEAEAQNPAFAAMLRAGIDLKTAYYAVHHEDIVKNLVQKAEQETSLKITDSIRARGTRPNENGLSNQSTAIIKTDVSRLTPKDRAEIARRVSQGEEISF